MKTIEKDIDTKTERYLKQEDLSFNHTNTQKRICVW